jgi:hypothetical protein
MAIKLAGTTVIDNSVVIGTLDGNESFFDNVNFTNFHPDVQTIPANGQVAIGDSDSGSASNQGYSVFTFAMTQN